MPERDAMWPLRFGTCSHIHYHFLYLAVNILPNSVFCLIRLSSLFKSSSCTALNHLTSPFFILLLLSSFSFHHHPAPDRHEGMVSWSHQVDVTIMTNTYVTLNNRDQSEHTVMSEEASQRLNDHVYLRQRVQTSCSPEIKARTRLGWRAFGKLGNRMRGSLPLSLRLLFVRAFFLLWHTDQRHEHWPNHRETSRGMERPMLRISIRYGLEILEIDTRTGKSEQSNTGNESKEVTLVRRHKLCFKRDNRWQGRVTYRWNTIKGRPFTRCCDKIRNINYETFPGNRETRGTRKTNGTVREV